MVEKTAGCYQEALGVRGRRLPASTKERLDCWIIGIVAIMTDRDATREYLDDVEVIDRNRLDAIQKGLVQEILNVGATLPFYRRLWRTHGFEPNDSLTWQEYAQNVPRFRKQALIDESRRGNSANMGIEAFESAPISNFVMTSGSSGFHTFPALTHNDLLGPSLRAQARALWMMRVRSGSRVLTLSPAWHALGLFESVALSWLNATSIIPWGSFTPRFLPNVLHAIEHLRPTHLFVSAPVLRGLLDLTAVGHHEPDTVFASVQFVGCAGEALSPAFRERIIRLMGLVDLFERGGSSDGMFGGSECFAHRGHHISADFQYVEIVDPDTGTLLPPGERGSAIVTNLTAGRSLYIRFEPEDLAAIIPGPCPCGRTHPVVEFYGRLADCVRFPDRIVAPYEVRFVLDRQVELQGRPFEMNASSTGGVNVVVLRSDATLKSVLATASRDLSNELDLPVDVSADGDIQMGWKGQRIRNPGTH